MRYGSSFFVVNDTTPALGSRHYRVLFDVVGACVGCPAPPAVTVPTTLDSLQYEGQLTYLVSTEREGQSIRYRLEISAVEEALAFLMDLSGTGKTDEEDKAP